MRIVTVLLFLKFISDIGNHGVVESQEYSRKRIQYTINCYTTTWGRHHVKSCNLTNIIVTDLDNSSLKLNGRAAVWNIMAPKWEVLEDACFPKDLFYIDYLFANHFHPNVIFYSGKVQESREYIYNITCLEFRVNLLEASVEGVSNNSGSCMLTPEGYNVSCRLKRTTYNNEYDVKIRRLENETLVISEAVHEKHRNVSSDQVCFSVESFPYDHFTVIEKEWDHILCEELQLSTTPKRCGDDEWNQYAWRNCSRVTLGSEVPELGPGYDGVIFKDLVTFCRLKLPEFNLCIEGKFCDVHYNDDFELYEFYTKLHKSYKAICENQENFILGNNCMNEILSDSTMNATYHSRIENCSSEAKQVDCMKYSEDALCWAVAQFLTHRTCASFAVVYDYKRLVIDHLDFGLSCTASLLHPCVSGIKDKDICSGSHLQYSTLMLLLAFMLQFI